MSLSRKRKKELRKLQEQASKLWGSQQVLLSESANVAREAGRQLGKLGREQVVPAVQQGYGKGVGFSRQLLTDKVVPSAGAVVGSALSVWDAANDTRERLASGRGLALPDAKTYTKKAEKYGKQATKALSAKFAEPKRPGIGAGGVIAIILGVAAAAGVVYAAWQTLRADDELWVADDPLRAPDA